MIFGQGLSILSGETHARVGTPPDVGARLRAAREAKQLSVREIADMTKIPVGALEALEENDVARLPGGIFSRGFVRSYAAAVGLDPKKTTLDFVAQLPVAATATGAQSDDRPHKEYSLFEHQWRVAGLGLGVLLVCSAGAALLFFGIRGVPTGTGTPTVPAAAVAPEPALRPRLEAPVRENPPTPLEPVPEAPLTIMLSPRRDCWVALRLDGESVVRRVMHAGEREVYRANEEIVLNVGDAGGFAFAINRQAGRSLGAAGEVVTVRITPQNYGHYVVP